LASIGILIGGTYASPTPDHDRRDHRRHDAATRVIAPVAQISAMMLRTVRRSRR